MTTTTNGYHPRSCRPCANLGAACEAHAKDANLIQPRHLRPGAVHADQAQAMLAQAIDYSAAADKARHDEAMEAAYTEGLQATIKCLGILQGITEADAHEMFMEALDS